MIFNLINGGRDALISLLLSLPVIIIALCVHETAHGYVAYKMGDPTAKNLGRLTLNPLKHLDPLGTLAMLVFGFGWAKPVPINARNFNNPRVGMALTGIAGPISNLILGLISCVLYSMSNVAYWVLIVKGASESVTTVIYVLTLLFFVGASLNFGLMAFNLIPIPPFDGSRFFYLLLPQRLYFKVMQYEQYIMIAILLLFLALSRVGLSPISFVSNGLFELVSEPLTNLFLKLANNLFF